MSSPHATTPTALGTFFTYPQDAVGDVTPYWRDAGGEYVRMTAACRRAFLATIEALIERAVVPANFGDVPANVSALSSLTFNSGMNSPYSLIELGPWATPSGRAGIGPLLRRGLPYGVWTRLVTLVWNLFRATRREYMGYYVLSWQGGFLDFTTSGFIFADDILWTGVDSQDWAGAFAYSGAEFGGEGEGPNVLPWGPFLGVSSGSAVNDEIQSMLDSLSSGIGIPSWTDGLYFVEEALDVSPDVMRKDGATPGNWFTQSAANPVGEVTWRRSAAAWGVLQAMLAQMIYTHLSFGFVIAFEHTEETREVLREVAWDSDAMDWTCVEIDDATTTTTTTLDNEIYNRRGYGVAGGIAPEVTLEFRVDNSSDDDLDVLALDDPPADVGPDGPYMVVGRTFLDFCIVISNSPQVWEKTAKRQHVTRVDGVRLGIADYPARALRGYVGEYGPVHFADSLSYSNASTHETWAKYSLRPETGDADLEEPVNDHASWLMSQVPGVSLPPISPFSLATFNAALSNYWNDFTAVYPTTPNVTVNGVPKYFPIAFYGYSGTLQRIQLDTTDNVWTGQIRLGYGNAESVFPVESAETYEFRARCAPQAIAGYKWNFKAMPITTS